MRCAIGLLFGIVPLLFSLSAGADTVKINDRTAGSAWETHYFGRFLLPLPENSDVVADYEQVGQKIELISKNADADMQKEVAQKTQDLKNGVARGTPSLYEKTVPLDNGSVVLVSRLKEFYTFNAFFRSDKNTLYSVMAETISVKGMPGGIEKMRKLSNALHFRTPHQPPPKGGFALEEGYTTLPNDRYLEKIYLGAQIYDHPGTYITFLTQSTGGGGKSLLQRFDEKDYDSKVNDLVNAGRISTLRKNKRTVAGIDGEEVAVRARMGGKRYYAFQFEYPGIPDSNTRPYIAIELGTHEEGSGFTSDEDALAWWDSLLRGFKPLE